jgi:hypothetical protein
MQQRPPVFIAIKFAMQLGWHGPREDIGLIWALLAAAGSTTNELQSSAEVTKWMVGLICFYRPLNDESGMK